MAQTQYSKSHVATARREGVMSRHEYVLRAREVAPRGIQLPQSKLMPLDVVEIRSAQRQREALKRHIKNNLSNEALAARFCVHVRSIEKVLSREVWGHVI